MIAIEPTKSTAYFGISSTTTAELGGDEDDFHSFKRQTMQADRDEKRLQKRNQRDMDDSVAASADTVPSKLPASQKTPKVVVF